MISITHEHRREGDRRVFNQYGVILVNPNKHPNVTTEFGQAFIDWLVFGIRLPRRTMSSPRHAPTD